MDTEGWLRQANKEIAKLNVGREFELKSLFPLTKWKELTVGDCSKFGKFFKNEVIEGHILNVRYIGKAKNNHALYEKTGEA